MPKDLQASIDIGAPPERVWAVVSDLERMPGWSPLCRWTKVFGRPRVGAWSVNLNRAGWRYWPTTARIVRYEPGRAIAFRINENKMTWAFELEPTEAGTRVPGRAERREIECRAATRRVDRPGSRAR